MMANPRPPRAPSGLGTRGRKLWRAVHADFEPDLAEHELLVECCRALDKCEALAAALADAPLTPKGSRGQVVAHPLLAELRSERLLLSRLLAQLAIPGLEDDDPDEWDGLTASERARKAARARWSNR
jgi:hypothetical protein